VSNRPNVSAALGDSRFYGIERIDLRAHYGAPCDGVSHPLANMGLAVAQLQYPNAGITGSTDLTKFEQDTAAWLQAEYDCRAGAGGIIGLADGALMRVSNQLWLQNANKVSFEGGRGTRLLTEGTGTTAAVRVSNANFGGGPRMRPLRNLGFQAFSGARPSFGLTQGGVAYAGFASTAALGSNTGYRTGAVALTIDNCFDIDIDGLSWNNYDNPTTWGDNVFSVVFRGCGATSNNRGFSWTSVDGNGNVMEKMTFDNCNTSNNNVGVFWDSSLVSSQKSQSGSVFFYNHTADYNVVSHMDIKLTEAGNPLTQATAQLFGGHIENTSDCMGSTNCYIEMRAGILGLLGTQVKCFGLPPPGLVHVADQASVHGEHVGVTSFGLPQIGVPLAYSTTTGDKYVSGNGCYNAYGGQKVRLLVDGNGIVMQRHATNKPTVTITVDPGGMDPDIYCVVDTIAFGGNMNTFTLPAAGDPFPPNSRWSFDNGADITGNGKSGQVQIMVPPNVTLVRAGVGGGYWNSSTATVAGPLVEAGQLAALRKISANVWQVVGRTVAS
jgi:hypothetical protein